MLLDSPQPATNKKQGGSAAQPAQIIPCLQARKPCIELVLLVLHSQRWLSTPTPHTPAAVHGSSKHTHGSCPKSQAICKGHNITAGG